MRKQLPLVQEMQQFLGASSNTATSDFPTLNKNAYVEVYKGNMDNSQKAFLCKRPALGSQGTYSPFGTSSGMAMAAASTDPLGGNVFHIISDGTLANTKFYLNSTVVAKPGGWAGNNFGHDIISLNGNAVYANYYWALTNYKEGALVDSAGTSTQITSANYTPWTNKSNMVAMDGYIFQADCDTGYIYNSDLNAPTTWSATGRIQASLFPGTIYRLMRFRKYLVAFKSRSIEFFENTGQPAPGSPLTAVPDLARKYGCHCNGWVTEAGDSLYWLGFNTTGRVGVFKMKYDDFSIEEVTTPYIAQLLKDNSTIGAYGGAAAAWVTWIRPSVIFFRNKELVTFPFPMNNIYMTFVYDTELKNWGMWTTSVTGTERMLPLSNVWRSSSTNATYVSGGHSNGSVAVSPTIYVINDQVYQDNAPSSGVDFTFKWSSDMHDFGTERRKYNNSLSVSYDQGSYTGAALSLSFYYIDTDDATSVVTARTRTLNSAGTSRVKFHRLGTFRSRRFVLQAAGNAPLRIGSIEVDIDMAEDDID